MNSKSLVNLLSETIHNLRKLKRKKKLTFLGCPGKSYHKFMYIAPSSGHSSLNIDLPFNLILKRLRFSDILNENAALFKKD